MIDDVVKCTVDLSQYVLSNCELEVTRLIFMPLNRTTSLSLDHSPLYMKGHHVA